MKHSYKTVVVCTLAGTLAALVSTASAASLVTFEEFTLPGVGYLNGSEQGDGQNAYTQNGVSFINQYSSDFGGYWSGFAISNHTDNVTPGFGNQYSAFSGSGFGGSANYAVNFYSPFDGPSVVDFAAATDLNGLGAYFTNTTYTALDMLDGSGFSKKFGGADGNDKDWLLLSIEGFNGSSSNGIVNFYLADYRFEDNSQDYIVDAWELVDFSSLGVVTRLEFTMSSSDVGDFGINTPTYFAVDNFLTPVPEPSAALLLLGFGVFPLLKRRRI